jgi:hypothetical protein
MLRNIAMIMMMMMMVMMMVVVVVALLTKKSPCQTPREAKEYLSTLQQEIKEM